MPLTSRITEGKRNTRNKRFKFTMMEISVCFSWAIDPWCTKSFFGCCNWVFTKLLLWHKSQGKGWSGDDGQGLV